MKPGRRSASPVNWSQVRQRLAARAAADGADVMSPERARAVLEERALALARVPAEADDAESIEAVVFSLADERYAIETTYVREVVRLGEVTSLPGAPDFFAGVVSLRGQVLAVVDLRRLFGLSAAGSVSMTRLVVLGDERPEFGVLAETVSEVVALRAGQLLDPAGGAGLAAEHIRGVTDAALIVLDGAALLRDPRLYIDQGEEPGGL